MRWVCLMRSRAYYAWTPTAAARCINSGHGTLGGGPKNEATTYRGPIARPFHHGTAGRSAPLQLRASGTAHVHASPAREISAQTAKIARAARSVSGGAKRMGAAEQTQHTRPGETIVPPDGSDR